MQPYLEIHGHAAGASHIAANLPCEDRSYAYQDGNCNIIAVADGHGDKNCFRSARGAELACQTAADELTEFARANEAKPTKEQIARLKDNILKTWNERVLTDITASPFTDDELLAVKDASRVKDRPARAYGSTLIAAAITKNWFLGLQIGDGTLVCAYSGGAYIEPLPEDKNCVGNVSASLCAPDAAESFRHCVSGVLPDAAMAVSDGVEESYDTNALYEKCMYTLIYTLLQNGGQRTQAELNVLLPEISRGGSRDDVSLALLASGAAVVTKPKPTLEKMRQKVSEMEEAAAHHGEALKEAQAARDNNQAELNALKEEIISLQKQLVEKELKYAELEEAHDAAFARCKEIEVKLNSAQSAAKQLLDTAEKFWLPKLKELEIQ